MMEFRGDLTFRMMLVVLALVVSADFIVADEWDRNRFDEQIAPLLTTHCLDCHSGSEPKGGLDLASRSLAEKGGDSGTAINREQPEDSLIWQRISADEMPPERPLSEAERTLIHEWLASGAVWGAETIDPFRTTSASRAGYDWWSLQPLSRPDVPAIKAPTGNAIDAFVRRRLQENGLPPSGPATPREIIRRMTFDLIGLPPAPVDVSAFEDACEKDRDAAVRELAAQLMSSHHFGERWARHWLDVVRFGESHGFERDNLRDTSWYYRDWVIHAMNNDMPYDEFVRLQLAGDILHPDDADAVIATGFLVAAPWDEVGQSQQSAAMKAVVRQDELEDYVGTIGQTFLGLTVNCARCHDHKFDPIRQKEYYQLAAAVGGVRHGQRQVNSPENQERLVVIAEAIQRHSDSIAEIDAAVRNRLLQKLNTESSDLPARVAPIARWDFAADTNDQIGNLHAIVNRDVRVSDGRLILDAGKGYGSTHPAAFALREKTLESWVRLDDLKQRGGATISIHSTAGAEFDAIVYGEQEPQRWMAGSDFFKRTSNVHGSEETAANDELIHTAISYHADGTIAVYRNGQRYGEPYESSGPHTFPAGQWKVMFGLRTGGPDARRQLRGQLEAAQLYDRALTDEQVHASFVCEAADVTHDQIIAALTDEERQRRQQLSDSITGLQHERDSRSPYSVYAVQPRKPDDAFVLIRGNPGQKGEPVDAGGVAAVPGVDAAFGLTADASDADRRVALANWITNQNNPLVARVIVNRLWHYHFGTGLVPTPNDFGFNGGTPSHPQLLDWLASELVESGWRLKHIHRLIVTSETYLQSSRHRDDAAAVDANNRLLWRKSPVRLDAESLRDAILSVSGQLNQRLGGAPFRDFEVERFNSLLFTMTDKDDPEYYRRTVYRMWVRSGRLHLLDAFDCPDPSTTAPKRAVTTTPIQSLALMNNSFVLRMADRFASRAQSEGGGKNLEQQVNGWINRVYQLAYGRAPDKDEQRLAGDFIHSHGLSAFCRVVLNSNEFIHVD